MSTWYYAIGKQQNGPISLDEIRRLVASGTIRPEGLVWREGMSQWQPVSEVSELAGTLAATTPPPIPSSSTGRDTLNPYQSPVSAAAESVRSGEEIVPGSQQIDIGACLTKVFELTKRHFWQLVLVGFVYLVLSAFIEVAAELLGTPLQVRRVDTEGFNAPPMAIVGFLVLLVMKQLISLFLSLGMARIALNLITGKEASLPLLFGEGGKVVQCAIATVLYLAMIVVGACLLILPGIYLALRFGQYQTAILDKDMKALDALHHSFRLTQGNALNLFAIALISLVIVIAGALMLLVGLFIAVPMTVLLSVITYSWLTHGSAVLTDGYKG